MGREERLSENLRSDDPSITLPWFYSTDTTNGGYCYYDKVTFPCNRPVLLKYWEAERRIEKS